MRNIKGYICIASHKGLSILFGENIHNHAQPYENLESNNITPFKTRDLAKKGKFTILKVGNFSSVKISKIEMKIAENLEEWLEFEDQKEGKSLVGIIYLEKGLVIFGPKVNDYGVGPPLGEQLGSNGFKTFEDFETAEYITKENARKSQSKGTLAYFRLG